MVLAVWREVLILPRATMFLADHHTIGASTAQQLRVERSGISTTEGTESTENDCAMPLWFSVLSVVQSRAHPSDDRVQRRDRPNRSGDFAIGLARQSQRRESLDITARHRCRSRRPIISRANVVYAKARRRLGKFVVRKSCAPNRPRTFLHARTLAITWHRQVMF